MPRILVVDDDDLVRRLIRETLLREGHEVRLAASGREALRLLAAERFDLLLTDVIMPDTDGLELIPKALAAVPGLPVVAMSGGGQWLEPESSLRMSLMLGARRTLAKPVGPKRLAAVVREVLAG